MLSADQPAATPDSGDDGGRPLVRAGLRGFLELQRFDVVAVIVLVLLAFGLRFASPIFPDALSGSGVAGALGVGYPYNPGECTQVPVGPGGADVSACGYVFDEIYFPVDAAKDLRQPAESYFDPEPPLAKLLMAPPIAFWGFNTWTWRLSTTLFGSLLVGLMYLVAMRLRRDRFFALCAALFVGIDGLAFVESRTGVIDIIAIFFVVLFYYVFLLHWQARTRRQWRITLYVMAAVAGLAFGAKLTALAPMVVAGALIVMRGLGPYLGAAVPWLRRLSGPRRHETVLWRNAAGGFAAAHYVAAAGIALAIFLACFSRYLTISHPDVYFFTDCNPLTPGLTGTAQTLPVPIVHVGSLSLPNPVRGVENIVQITRASLQYHAQECHSHPYSSLWYSWPVMEHPVLFYYSQPQATGPVASITDMGDPGVWWLGIPALLFCLWRSNRGPTWWRLGLPLFGLASLAVMIVLFNVSIRYFATGHPGAQYTASQFTALFHRDPTPSDELSRVLPGALYAIAFVGVIVFTALTALSAVVSRAFVPAFIVLGYVTAWMMWVPGNMRRVLFFYHALGMLIFTALALAYALTAMRRSSLVVAGRRIPLAPVAYAGVAAVVMAFVFFYPVWTAMPQGFADHEMRIWVDTW